MSSIYALPRLLLYFTTQIIMILISENQNEVSINHFCQSYSFIAKTEAYLILKYMELIFLIIQSGMKI